MPWIVETSIEGKQLSTPANPSAGYDKFYFKSDDNLYRLTSAGAEKIIGPSLTIGTTIIGGTANAVLHIDGSGNLGSDSLFLFDTTNNRMNIGTASAITSALTLVPLVATDTALWLQGAASQSGNYLTIQDSAGNELANFNSSGTLNFTKASGGQSLTDTRSLVSSVGGYVRGFWLNNQTHTYTANPSGILPVSGMLFAPADNRTLNLTTATADNFYGMEFNMVRGATFLDNGITSAVAGSSPRAFVAIRSQFQDQGHYTNTHTTPRNSNANIQGIFTSLTGSYVYDGTVSMLHEINGTKFTVAMTPSISAGGTLRRLETGSNVTLTGTATGTSLGIAYYGKVITYTDNYFLANNSGANSYMGFNNAKSLYGGTAFVLPLAAANYSITGNYGSIYYDATNLVITGSEVGTGKICLATATYIGAATTPTAILHLLAGTTAASTAPLKFTSGTNMTAAEAGAIEFTTDDFFATITTGAARKAFILDDGARLTSGRVPFATTNGRLIDDADMTFLTDTLTVTKIIGSTSIKVGTAAGYLSSDGSAGATGSFTTTDLKTVTVKDGIITAIV